MLAGRSSGNEILYLLECKTSLYIYIYKNKFGASVCEAVLNLQMKHRTGSRQSRSLWTRPCGAKPWPALPNHHVRSLLFWDIMQFVCPYWRFRTSVGPIFEGQGIEKRESMIEV